ncbi:hypothetical protein PPBDW_I20333 [Photobacterium kishitanii]|nr:hypothetical protein PPBDW_I20333 [Photobacterium kishitanii]
MTSYATTLPLNMIRSRVFIMPIITSALTHTDVIDEIDINNYIYTYIN